MVEMSSKDEKPVRLSSVDNLAELGKRDFDYPVEQFIHAIKHNEEIEVTGAQGRASVAIINGVYRSANEGKRIQI